MTNSLMGIAAKCFAKAQFMLKNMKAEKKEFRTEIKKRISKDKNLSKLNVLTTVKNIVDYAPPESTEGFIYCEIANFLVNIGHPQLAQTYYKLSLEQSFTAFTYSLYLQCLLLDPACSEAFLYEESHRYNQFFAHIKPYGAFANEVKPDRPLRVGYLCHFFHNSVSQSLLIPFLRAHDRERVKVYCYSDAPIEEVPDDIKTCADEWRDCLNLDDDALTQLIRADQIDVLLELNGHCAANRYGVIARRAAPIQINYYNQAATTGMLTLDYILVGDHITLNHNERCFSEAIYPLRGISGVAIFPETFPPVSEAPFLKKNYITFGSFGAAHKVNADLIKLWSRVLKAVPQARFYMKAGVLKHEPYLNAYKNMFMAEGIDVSRVHFEGYSEHIDMLKRYGEMDIALDTYPHAGGTTTMEAIWQGVPVVSLTGERYCSQNGKVVNTCIGHPELIAYSEDEFVAKAVALANNPERIVQYRKTLRDDFKHSALADPRAFAGRLEAAYADMWQRYCKKIN